MRKLVMTRGDYCRFLLFLAVGALAAVAIIGASHWVLEFGDRHYGKDGLWGVARMAIGVVGFVGVIAVIVLPVIKELNRQRQRDEAESRYRSE